MSLIFSDTLSFIANLILAKFWKFVVFFWWVCLSVCLFVFTAICSCGFLCSVHASKSKLSFFSSADAATFQFDGTQFVKVTMPEESHTQAEDISLRFRTMHPNGLLFMTVSDESNDKMEVYLEGGIIHLGANVGSGEKVNIELWRFSVQVIDQVTKLANSNPVPWWPSVAAFMAWYKWSQMQKINSNIWADIEMYLPKKEFLRQVTACGHRKRRRNFSYDYQVVSTD